ncbi:MAG: metallophosphatase family protein [Prevotellaceae bacterium]|jgi:putative phosphoesterase|nr:metallophosphatase family protein [Prevotellaceae bacterium]
MKIGILSDTHGLFDEPLRHFFAEVDEVWHAGDIGGSSVAEAIAAFKPLRAVYGNIDGEDIRRSHPLYQRFACEGVQVLMTHIGGYPGRYDPSVGGLLRSNPPQLFVCGHSHILKVMFDKKLSCLHINPGAAGRYGFHAVRTAVRLEIQNGSMSGLEVGEWRKN